MIRPFDWGRLPSWSRASAEQARAVAGLFARPLRVDGLALTGTLRAVAPLVWDQVPPHALVIPLVGGDPAVLILDSAITTALAARLLGDDAPELAAPRPATLVERGVAAVAAAALLEEVAAGSPWRVGEPLDPASARGLFAAPPLAAELVVDVAGQRGVALIAGVAPVPSAPGVRVVGHVAVTLRAVLARTQVGAGELGGLGARDVVRFSGGPSLRLAVARGSFAAEAAWRGATGPLAVRVTRGYQPEGGSMDPALAADLPVELTLELGRVTLSTAEAMALAPGAVLTLPRPVGGLVEVAAGGRVIARGELVDVDGSLGVRVVEMVG